MDNLPEFKDIHIPDGVSVFPLAYGWWVILSAIILLIVTIKFFLWAVKTSRKYYALKMLQKINTKKPIESAVKISELLRRICIYKYKNANVLYAQEWIDFLNSKAKVKINGKYAKLLEYAPYMDANNNTYTQDDAEAIKEFAKQWIGVNV